MRVALIKLIKVAGCYRAGRARLRNDRTIERNLMVARNIGACHQLLRQIVRTRTIVLGLMQRR
jgi:hypothetical protein